MKHFLTILTGLLLSLALRKPPPTCGNSPSRSLSLEDLVQDGIFTVMSRETADIDGLYLAFVHKDNPYYSRTVTSDVCARG